MTLVQTCVNTTSKTFNPYLPVMRLISNGSNDDAGVLVPYHLKELLHRKHFREKDNELSKTEEDILDKFLLELVKKGHQWICCHCSPSLSCYTIRKQDNGNLVPVVVKKRTKHDSQCPFYRNSENKTEGAQPDLRIPLMYELGEYIGIHFQSKRSERKSSSSERKGESSSRRSKNSLASLIWTMINDSELNIFDVECIPSLESQKTRILQFFNKVCICKNVNASRYFSFVSRYSDLEMVCKSLEGSRDDWKNVRRHGFCLFVANEIEKGKDKYTGDDSYTLHGENGKVMYLKSVLRPGNQNTHGPYLVVFSVSHNDNGNKFYPQTAFAIPIVSEYLIFPVESHYERMTFKVLKWFFNKEDKRLPVNIFKPVMEMSIGEEFYRPDFLIEYKGRRAILEVLGFNNEEYLFPKSLKVRAWRDAGENVFTFEAFRYDPNSREFWGAIASISEAILAVLVSGG